MEIEEIDLEEKKFCGIKMIAIYETLIFLAALLLYNLIKGEGDRFLEVHPHPFWVIVLLVSCQYGTLEGLFTTCLCILFIYVGNVPERLIQESLFAYEMRIVKLPLLWFATAFILGELRGRVDTENRILKRELIGVSLRAESITDAYDKLKVQKDNLVVKLASQMKTMAPIYKTFKQLETFNPAQILLSLDRVIVDALNPSKFSVFALGPDGFEAITCFGWEEGDEFKRRFPKDHPLSVELFTNRKMLCVISHIDEKLLQGEGLMAAPLVDPISNEIIGMIKIEKIEFQELNVSRLEVFKTLSEWVGGAYAKAKEYRRAKNNSIYSNDTDVFSSMFYKIQKASFLKLAKEFNGALTQIMVTLNKKEGRDQKECDQIGPLVAAIQEVICSRGQVFTLSNSKVELAVLFPFITSKEAEQICHEVVMRCHELDGMDNFNFHCKVEPILEIESTQIEGLWEKIKF